MTGGGNRKIHFPLCVCPGFTCAAEVHNFLYSSPTVCVYVYTYACAFVSAGKRTLSSCLDHSYLKDVCVGKQRAAATHTPTSPPALSLIYEATHISTRTHIETHTHGNVSVDHKEVRQDS